MRRMCLLWLLLVLTGCALPANSPAPSASPESAQSPPHQAPPGPPEPAAPQDPAASPASSALQQASPEPPAAPEPTPEEIELGLPALPLWGEPGFHLAVDGAKYGSAWAYAPVTILGAELQPVRLPQGTVFVKLEGNEIYLHGVLSERGGYVGLEEPQFLHRFPLEAGASWEIRFPGTMGDRFSYKVLGAEAVETPAGEQLGARIEVTRRTGKTDTEWWVPGYGLVKLSSSQWRPTQELRREPEDVRIVGQVAPDLQALIWDDDGDAYRVTTVDGERELFRVGDPYWRSWYYWVRVGDQDLLAHEVFPGSWAVNSYRAYRYDPESGQFERVSWVDSAGNHESIAGYQRDTGWTKDGAFVRVDHTGYPTRIYTYRWDGTAMRSDPATEQLLRAQSAEALVRRIFDTPPLDEEDFIAIFADEAVGRQAREVLSGAMALGTSGGTVTEVEPGSLLVKVKDRLFLFRVEQGEHDYQIVFFAEQPQP